MWREIWPLAVLYLITVTFYAVQIYRHDGRPMADDGHEDSLNQYW